LIEAARTVVAERGIDVSALDIATAAGVGVGTLYRRFGTKEALIERVVLDLLDEARIATEKAVTEPDAWSGLVAALVALSESHLACRGLTQTTSSDPLSTALRDRFVALRTLVSRAADRAHAEGVLRSDVTWRDLVLLSRAPLEADRCLGLAGNSDQWRRTLAVLMDGLRAPGDTPLPGEPPADTLLAS
jgi:AcrR family transcriptional regulator